MEYRISIARTEIYDLNAALDAARQIATALIRNTNQERAGGGSLAMTT